MLNPLVFSRLSKATKTLLLETRYYGQIFNFFPQIKINLLQLYREEAEISETDIYKMKVDGQIPLNVNERNVIF